MIPTIKTAPDNPWNTPCPQCGKMCLAGGVGPHIAKAHHNSAEDALVLPDDFLKVMKTSNGLYASGRYVKARELVWKWHIEHGGTV